MLDIVEIKTALGSTIETNESVSEIVGWTPDEIESKTGIKKRFISSKNDSAETLAIQAIEKMSKEKFLDVDLIVSVSNTQKTHFPNISNLVHSKLNLNENVKCLGLNQGCSGYVDAIELVYSYFESNISSKALVITADTYSKFLKNSRSTRTLFSDGASATLLKKNLNAWKRISSTSNSMPDSQEYLKRQVNNGLDEILMDGPRVLHFSISMVQKYLAELYPTEKCLLIPHQAGKIILDKIKTKAPDNIRIIEDYQNYGNLVSTSIPNALEKIFKNIDEDYLILSGFGVGLSHNSILFTRL